MGRVSATGFRLSAILGPYLHKDGLSLAEVTMAAQPGDPGFNFFIQTPNVPAMLSLNAKPNHLQRIATEVGVLVCTMPFSARETYLQPGH
jgi:hypothetical protein